MNDRLPPRPPLLTGSPDPTVAEMLIVGRSGPLSYLSNVRAVLDHDPRLQGQLQRDTLAQRIEWMARPGQCALSDVQIFFERVYRFQPKKADLRAELLRVARPVHPVAAWLDTLTWDGRSRLDTVLHDTFGAEPSPLLAAYGRRTFIGLVARARQPGCKLDTVLLLSGPQGVFKSSAALALSPDPAWAAAIPLDAASKDGMQDLVGKWLIELEELEDFRAATAPRRKAFLSRAIDRYRPSYGSRSGDFARTCAFIATTNQTELLRDPTGARRFWPIYISRRVDLEALVAQRDQLFAEADHRFQQGERWWLDAQESARHAEHATVWRKPDPWEGPLQDWVARRGLGFTAEAALEGCFGFAPNRQTPELWTRVGTALHAIGMTTTRPRSTEKRRPRRYVWPEGAGPT